MMKCSFLMPPCGLPLLTDLMSFDELSSNSEKLSHPTASRPKMPGRRLPAQFGGGNSVREHADKHSDDDKQHVENCCGPADAFSVSYTQCHIVIYTMSYCHMTVRCWKNVNTMYSCYGYLILNWDYISSYILNIGISLMLSLPLIVLLHIFK